MKRQVKTQFVSCLCKKFGSGYVSAFRKHYLCRISGRKICKSKCKKAYTEKYNDNLQQPFYKFLLVQLKALFSNTIKNHVLRIKTWFFAQQKSLLLITRKNHKNICKQFSWLKFNALKSLPGWKISSDINFLKLIITVTG